MTARRWWMGCGVVLAALVVSCGSEPSQDATAEQYSPLERELGVDLDELAAQSVASAQGRHIEVQQLTADCMRSKGWEYWPKPYIAPAPRDSKSILQESLGLGISSSAFPQSMISGGSARGHSGDSFEDPAGSDDRNAIYQSSLRGEQARLYLDDLHGPQSSSIGILGVSPDDERNVPQAPGGCFGFAWASVELSGEEELVESFGYAFAAELEEVRAGVRSGSIAQRYESLILGCLRLAGFGGEEASDVRGRIWAQVFELQDVVERRIAADGSQMLNAGEELRLGQIQAEEGALADAIRDCGGDPADMQFLDSAHLVEAMHSAERAFVDEYRAEIEAFLFAFSR